MRKLIIILLTLIAINSYSQDTITIFRVHLSYGITEFRDSADAYFYCINNNCDSIVVAEKIINIPEPIANIDTRDKREEKVSEICDYMKSQLNDAYYQVFLSNARTFMDDYVKKSNCFLYWILTMNNSACGSYSTSGFMTKTIYATPERQQYILNIITK